MMAIACVYKRNIILLAIDKVHTHTHTHMPLMLTPTLIRQLEKKEQRKRYDLRRAWNNKKMGLEGGAGKENVYKERWEGQNRSTAKEKDETYLQPPGGLHVLRKRPHRQFAYQSSIYGQQSYRPTRRAKVSKYIDLVPGIALEANKGEVVRNAWAGYNRAIIDKSSGDGDCGYHSIAKGLKHAKGIDTTGPVLRGMIATNPLWSRVTGTFKGNVVRGRVPWMSQERFDSGVERARRGKITISGWMGDAEISILSWMYDVCIVVYHPNPDTEFDRWSIITPSGGDANTVECTDPEQMIYLINHGQLHYDLMTNLKEEGEIITSEDDKKKKNAGEETDDDDDDLYSSDVHYNVNSNVQGPVTPPLSEDDMEHVLTDDESQLQPATNEKPESKFNFLPAPWMGKSTTLHGFQPYNKGRRVSAI